MSEPDPSYVRPQVAAGVLFLDDDDRILLVVPSYKDYLDLPGGFVEAGEHPKAAAQREVLEELGIEPAVGRLLVVDWWNDSSEGAGGPKVLLVFDGGQLPQAQLDRITVDGDEITGYKFHAPHELATITIPRLANRVGHALAAHHDATTRYLEDGQPTTPTPRG